MTRSFSLAGLLRIRRTQERAAAGRLSRANLDAAQSAARERHLRTALGGTPTEISDTRTLAALAAARAAGRGSLADIAGLAALHREECDAATRAHRDARRAVKGLDKLSDAHRRRTEAEQRHREQRDLDEIATHTRGEQEDG